MKHNEEIVAEFVKRGDLKIDEEGRVWRTRKRVGGALGRVVELDIPVRAEGAMPNGYFQIQVWDGDGKCITCGSHRLVYFLHNGIISDELIIHHIDENKQNNNICNLKAMTFSEHNRLHPRKTWNKGSKTKTPNGRNIKEWHQKTIDSKERNYKIRALKTYYMVEIQNQHPAAVAKILKVSKRTVYTQISDCIGRGWLENAEDIHA
jgi:hypothetical protein